MRYLGWLFVFVLLVGCTDSGGGKPQTSNAASSPGKKRQIAVIAKEASHEFWKSVHAGAENAAKELGNVEILWKAPSRGDDPNEQISIVQNFVTRGVDGICLAPIDSRSLGDVVKSAKQAGIPTVIIDSGLEDTSNTISFVATDNKNGGHLAALELGKRLSGKGNVILLRYNPGSESTEQRELGFLETIKKDYPDIKLISDDQYAGTDENTALDKSQQLLLKYGKDVNGIFAVNESCATGMLRALDEAGLTKKVTYIGFDSSDRLVQALADGKIQGLVLQDPVNMAYLGVKTMCEHLDGKPVKARVPTGETVATPENMNEPRIHKLLYPEQF
jgi:ribose transport system substrate-binding protein